MRYYHLVVLGLLMLAAGACKKAVKGGEAAVRIARPNDALFPIVVHGRWGFMDSTGAVVIAPRFAQVQAFAEGLAPAREGGHYGYIDKKGQFVLPPRYAYATPFRGGLALIEQDSIPQLIDHTGQLLALPTTYKQIEWLPNPDGSGSWVGVVSVDERQLLTAQGRSLLSAQLASAGELSNNRRVVSISIPVASLSVPPPDPASPAEEEVTGVLDGRGQLVIPYRRFDQISAFSGGLATATLHQRVYSRQSQQTCVIDTTGRVVTYLPTNKYSVIDEGLTDGVLHASLITRVIDALNTEDYPVVLDPTGEVLFRRPDLRLLSKYSHNRAWATGQGDEWFLLNKAGQQLNKIAVASVLWSSGADEAPTFADGVELVALAHEQGYAALDTSGRVVRRLPGSRASHRDPERLGNLMAFYAADSTFRLGFWNWRTGLVLNPRFSAIDPAGYQHGLLAVVENHRLGYLSPTGRYVWREAPKLSAPLNLDYQRRGFYTVASPPLPRHRGVGGWAASGNLAKPIALWQFSLPILTLQVSAASTADAYAPSINGHKLAIVNASADTVVFNAQDSGLYLTLQALAANGRWRDIEYTPSSFCGNSYHQVFLAPGQYWQVVVPAYVGAQHTLLRAKLLVNGRYNKQQKVVYSNAFTGSVNPAQYWQQQGHSPQDIMDPYFN